MTRPASPAPAAAPGSPDIHGEVAPGFEAVADAFRANFSERGEIGASVCVFHAGQKVVDLWGGWADAEARRPWERDTVAILFSATKGLAAMTMLALADAGLVDYDAPIARYWPEFGAAGKEAITVRMLMNHRAGLNAIDLPLTFADLADPARVAPALEAQRPRWTPGTDQGYHAVSYGLYVGELVRRITGARLGLAFAERITRPLGLDNDLWIGTPESAEPRVARLYPAGDWATRLTKIFPRLLFSRGNEGRVYRAFVRKSSDTARAFANPIDLGLRDVARHGTRELRARDMPWSNGVGNARSLATAYAALIGVGGPTLPRVVSERQLAPVFARQSWSPRDRVMLKAMGFSQGFIKDEPHLFSPHPESFGHPGAGGILGWADPVSQLAIGYVMNRMDFRVRSPRAVALARAAQAAAAALAEPRAARAS